MPANGLGLCCRPSAYDFETVRRTVLWYLLQGGRHLDTADVYINHGAVGEAIRQAVSLGIPRSEIFVTTKIFPSFFGKDLAVKSVHRYLKELGLEYIDLVLLHFPSHPLGRFGECKGKEWKECRVETWQALSKLRDGGYIREMGVSNFNVRQMEEIDALGAAPIAASQFCYNPWATDWLVQVAAHCHKHGIVATAYSSLGAYFQKAKPQTVVTLKNMASSHNSTVSQILLRWALQKNMTVIPGTGNPKHMRENLAVYDLALSSDEMSKLDGLRSDETGMGFFFTPEDTT